MSKVLFLDVDGVLNNGEYYSSDRFKENQLPYPLNKFDPKCIERLNYILKSTNANIVVSSSWRFDKGLQGIFDRVGIIRPIIGITPWGERYTLRGQEIQDYITKHDIEKYCIIDDDDDMLETQMPYLVKCDDNIGLNDDNMKMAIKVLNSRCNKETIYILKRFKYLE